MERLLLTKFMSLEIIFCKKWTQSAPVTEIIDL